MSRRPLRVSGQGAGLQPPLGVTGASLGPGEGRRYSGLASVAPPATFQLRYLSLLQERFPTNNFRTISERRVKGGRSQMRTAIVPARKPAEEGRGKAERRLTRPQNRSLDPGKDHSMAPGWERAGRLTIAVHEGQASGMWVERGAWFSAPEGRQ
jgi:hypothetical protein